MTTKNGKNSAESVPEPKWKIPPQRIESDDCTVYVGREIEDGEITDEGTPYKVHEGEYVELFPVRSLKELMALTDIGNNTAGSLRTLCIELSQRIMEWDWTGMDGKPLPQPTLGVEKPRAAAIRHGEFGPRRSGSRHTAEHRREQQT